MSEIVGGRLLRDGQGPLPRKTPLKPIQKISQFELENFTKKWRGNDRYTLRYWWRMAKRMKSVMVLNPVASHAIIYVVPISKFDPEKKNIELRWKRGIVFHNFRTRGVRFIFDTNEMEAENAVGQQREDGANDLRGESGVFGAEDSRARNGVECSDSDHGSVDRTKGRRESTVDNSAPKRRGRPPRKIVS